MIELARNDSWLVEGMKSDNTVFKLLDYHRLIAICIMMEERLSESYVKHLKILILTIDLRDNGP